MSRLLRSTALLLLGTLPLLLPAQGPVAKKHALLVGINRYHHAGFTPLGGAENDATELADFLKGQGYAVTKLIGPQATRDNVLAALKLATLKRGHDELVLVALAGHGLLFGSSSFFCPYDAEPRDEVSLLAFSEIYEQLGECGAGSKLLLVDACREATRGAGKLPETPDGMGVLMSCKAGQFAFETKDRQHGYANFRRRSEKLAEGSSRQLVGIVRGCETTS